MKHNIRSEFWQMADFEKRRATLTTDEQLLFTSRNNLTRKQQRRYDALIEQHSKEERAKRGTANRA